MLCRLNGVEEEVENQEEKVQEVKEGTEINLNILRYKPFVKTD